MSNPYESPQFESQKAYAGERKWNVEPSGLVQQVRVVAVLNGVQGGLEILTGLMYVFAAAFVPAMIAMDQNFPPNAQQDRPDPQMMFWMMIVVYGGMAAGGLIAGALRLIATFKNFNYRGRTFGVISLAAGMLSMSTCYCIPTALGILIYGLIVFLNPAVTVAFEMGEAGEPVDRIQYEFSTYRNFGGEK